MREEFRERLRDEERAALGDSALEIIWSLLLVISGIGILGLLILWLEVV